MINILGYSSIFLAVAVMSWFVCALITIHTYLNYKHEYIAPAPTMNGYLKVSITLNLNVIFSPNGVEDYTSIPPSASLSPPASAPELATTEVLPPIIRSYSIPDCEPPPYDEHELYDFVPPSNYSINKSDEAQQS